MKSERGYAIVFASAKGIDISIYTTDFKNEYLSLTDIARYKSDTPHDVVKNWLRGRDTIEFLGLWESLHNPEFKQVDFDLFKSQAGANAFTMSPSKWIEGVNAIGIVTKAGRYGGTYAHSDIAFEFASWVSPEFKLYIIKDYQRLKYDENSRLSLDWNLHRELSKINYKIHTDAIKQRLILPELTTAQISKKYESYNAILIEQGKSQSERLILIRESVVRQFKTLEAISESEIRREMNVIDDAGAGA